MARRGVQYVGFWLLACGGLFALGLLAASIRHPVHFSVGAPARKKLQRAQLLPAHGYAITDLGQTEFLTLVEVRRAVAVDYEV